MVAAAIRSHCLRELPGPIFLAGWFGGPVSAPGLEAPLWQTCAALAVLLGITAAAVAWGRRRPYLLVGWLWYLGMLAPVIGFIQVGAAALADRNTYLAQIGLAIAIVWIVADACQTWPQFRRFRAIAAMCVLTVFVVAAWRQTSYWHDQDETLWTHTLACTFAKRCYGPLQPRPLLRRRKNADGSTRQWRQ